MSRVLRPLPLAALAVAGLHARSRGRTMRVAGQITQFDPEDPRQANRILWLLGSRDFAWDSEQALSLALFRTYAVPEISTVLAGTREFLDRGQKRYDDTELVYGHMGKRDLEAGDGGTALRRMNAMHGAFDIDHDLFVYVLSTFVLEPLRWGQRWGWRPSTDRERRATVVWHNDLGHRMGLRELPQTWQEWDAWNRRFEAERFRFHPDNRLVGDATIQLLLDRKVPAPLHDAARVVVRAMIDEPRLLDAFGYEPAPRAVVRAVDLALRSRALVQRHLLPERRRPHDLTELRRPTYPDGHHVDELGTFPDDATKTAVKERQATV